MQDAVQRWADASSSARLRATRETLMNSPNSNLGPVSMQERLKLVNGSVAIESKPGAGTKIRAAVPLRPNSLPSVVDVGGDRMAT
jgi:signal transduction histidine kinase